MHVSSTYTIREAAQATGVTDGTIRAAIVRGELQRLTTAGGWDGLLSKAAVERWGQQERKRGPKPKARHD